MKKTLPNGAYTPEFQGHRQRVDEAMVAAVVAVIPKECSIVDLGCGIGKLSEALRRRGYDCQGIDGTPGIMEATHGLVMEQDLTDPGFATEYGRNWDWGICTEVGEHVPEAYEGALLSNITRVVKEGLILTWADHDAKGYGHVNCKSQVYVASRLAAEFEMQVDEEMTQLLRSKIRAKYRERSMVVRRHREEVLRLFK